MYESYNTYNPYGLYNPYYNYNQQPQQPVMKQNQPIYRPQNVTLQGKVVDSLDVVKATDIPYDGSISYFPLTDGSSIITKQLQQDGTSKVIIYKPIIDNEDETEKPKYITESDFKEQLKDLNDKYITESDFKEELRNINSKYITEDEFKEQIKGISSKDFKDLKEDIKTLKRKLEDITDDMKYKKEK